MLRRLPAAEVVGAPRPVAPEQLARSVSGEHRFDHDELDPAEHRRALLALAQDLGARCRSDQQAAGGLSLTVRYADGTSTTRSRTLTGPTHHSRDLTDAATTLYDALGLQSLSPASSPSTWVTGSRC
ncbi:DinB/UmuC family translesion DNA polymerase [Streptomyces sp. NBC_01465]|uniref:DinB/UmuC family translesion DNA polymerase n=1 Tax=Streptomyces sp. NBC_01465 TaxID=2903878 RepID=UPI002E3575F0|nr:hypothetical protein [Streptomyces sp. NBC_01465]